jgi:hypothetical protein
MQEGKNVESKFNTVEQLSNAKPPPKPHLMLAGIEIPANLSS